MTTKLTNKQIFAQGVFVRQALSVVNDATNPLKIKAFLDKNSHVHQRDELFGQVITHAFSSLDQHRTQSAALLLKSIPAQPITHPALIDALRSDLARVGVKRALPPKIWSQQQSPVPLAALIAFQIRFLASMFSSYHAQSGTVQKANVALDLLIKNASKLPLDPHDLLAIAETGAGRSFFANVHGSGATLLQKARATLNHRINTWNVDIAGNDKTAQTARLLSELIDKASHLMPPSSTALLGPDIIFSIEIKSAYMCLQNPPKSGENKIVPSKKDIPAPALIYQDFLKLIKSLSPDQKKDPVWRACLYAHGLSLAEKNFFMVATASSYEYHIEKNRAAVPHAWQMLMQEGILPATDPSLFHTQNALVRTISMGHRKWTQWLIDHGVTSPHIDPVENKSIIGLALTTKSQAIIDCLNLLPKAQFKPNINAQDLDGETALHHAVRAMDQTLVQSLIEQGADPSIKNNKGKTPLESATRSTGARAQDNLAAITNLLQQNGAAVTDPQALLVQACRSLSLPMAQKCIEELGANVNLTQPGEITPLHLAITSLKSMFTEKRAQHAKKGQLALVNYLIDQGANVNAQDYTGATPLHHATELGQAHVVDQLLHAGADPLIKNKREQTPMHMDLRYVYGLKQVYIDIVYAFFKHNVSLSCDTKKHPIFNELRQDKVVDQLIKSHHQQQDLLKVLEQMGEKTTLSNDARPARKSKM